MIFLWFTLWCWKYLYYAVSNGTTDKYWIGKDFERSDHESLVKKLRNWIYYNLPANPFIIVIHSRQNTKVSNSDIHNTHTQDINMISIWWMLTLLCIRKECLIQEWRYSTIFHLPLHIYIITGASLCLFVYSQPRFNNEKIQVTRHSSK